MGGTPPGHAADRLATITPPGRRGIAWGWLTLVSLLVLATLPPPGLAHELPTFPRVRLLVIQEDPADPARRVLAVEIRDPRGREPVVGADVVVSGLEASSGVRLREQWLTPTPEAGMYQGVVEFPGRGVWDLTVTVRGRYVGEGHVRVVTAGSLPRPASRGRQPELAFGWAGWRFLLLNWGHLLGFGLWLGVSALALAAPVSPRTTVTLTWLALALGVGTGFNKMEYGTPFPWGLRLLRWDVPPIFFGREYLVTLTVKHALILTAMGVTVIMTRQAWRASGAATAPRFRLLVLVNLFIVLAIGAAAAVLGFLHAIVLHFA